MEIIYLYNKNIFNIQQYSCFALKLNQSKDIWLFNCCEGCQNYCIQAKIKISQISKIIITELKINNISGLIGLLSSLSLIDRKKNVYIYAPLGLKKYLNLTKRYSKTDFKYNLYIISLNTGLLINAKTAFIYVCMNVIQNQSYDLLILSIEKQLKFNMIKAHNFQLLSGPLYGELKKCSNFILPDGLIIDGHQFINIYSIGNKCIFISWKYHTRKFNQVNQSNNRTVFCNTI